MAQMAERKSPYFLKIVPKEDVEEELAVGEGCAVALVVVGRSMHLRQLDNGAQ